MKTGDWRTRIFRPAISSALVTATAVVGQVAEAKLPIPQTDDALVGEGFRQFGAERAVHDGIGLLRRLEQEGKIDQREVLRHPAHQAGVHHRHFDGAALNGGKSLHVTAQRPAGEEPDFDLAVALLLHQFGELLHALDLGMALLVLRRELQGVAVDLGGGGLSQDQQARKGQTGGDLGEAVEHGLSSSCGSVVFLGLGWRVSVRTKNAAGTVTRAGNRTSSNSTINWATMKGQTPLMTSSMLIFDTPATTFSTVPTGGVIRPIALFMMNSTPK